MPVTSGDIVFYPGVRLTDDASGGGAPRYWPLPDGVTNNLFDGVTAEDRAAGALSIRKVYAGLMNSDAAGFTNAYVFLESQVGNGYTNSVLFKHGGRPTLRNATGPSGAYEALINAYQWIDRPGEPDFQTIIGTSAKGSVTIVNGSVPIEIGHRLKFFGSPQRFPGNVTGASPVHGIVDVDFISATGTHYGLATTTIDYTIVWESPGGFIRGDSLCSRVEPAVLDTSLGALQPALPVGVSTMGAATAGADEIFVATCTFAVVPPFVSGDTPRGVAGNALQEWGGQVPIFRRGGKIAIRDGGTSEVAEVAEVMFGFTPRLRLVAPLVNSYSSSATVHGLCPVGDVAASVDTLMSQRTWSRVYADTPVGPPPTTGDLYTGTIGVSNAGTVEQRWAVVFRIDDPTQFDVYGESLGFIGSGDTSTDFAFDNPSTGQPYFTLPAAGWESGIEIGNAFRFNTHGSLAPEALWITRMSTKDPSNIGTHAGGVTLALRDGATGAEGNVDIPWDESTQLGGQGTAPTAPAAPTGLIEYPALSPDGSIPAQAVYRQAHTFSVVDEATSDDLDVRSLSLAIEDGSVCWTLSATGGEDLYALFAESVTPRIVVVTIDGIEWRFIVEGARRSRNGPADSSVQFTGRSAAMAAAEPYTLPRNWINDGAITAAQMCVFSQDPGVEVQWFVEDWLIPDKVLTFAGSPLALVQRVAESIGAQVICDRSAETLFVIPRYRLLPADWAAATANVTIALGACKTDAFERADKPAYNGVYVSGQQQGVIVFVFLNGTDGTAQAPLVTDLLLTDAPANRQRGFAVLGAGGKQARVSMTLPVLTGSGRPGVLSPGQLVRMTDGATWTGMVRAVTVTVNGPSVEQTIVVERHL